MKIKVTLQNLSAHLPHPVSSQIGHVIRVLLFAEKQKNWRTGHN